MNLEGLERLKGHGKNEVDDWKWCDVSGCLANTSFSAVDASAVRLFSPDRAEASTTSSSALRFLPVEPVEPVEPTEPAEPACSSDMVSWPPVRPPTNGGHGTWTVCTHVFTACRQCEPDPSPAAAGLRLLGLSAVKVSVSMDCSASSCSRTPTRRTRGAGGLAGGYM